MITTEQHERVVGWFTGRLPEEWTDPEIAVDREEITVVLRLQDSGAGAELSGAAAEEARVGRARAFREETREQRMGIAREAERRFGRKVAWGVQIGTGDTAYRELFTHLAVPVMTRLRQPQRLVLDTLVDSGVARSRSEALAWCVRLVAQHEGDWLKELRGAMDAVSEVRERGPAA